MEYYYRCSKCGARTPSFDSEENLIKWCEEYEWNIDIPACTNCERGIVNNIADKYIMLLGVISLIIMIVAILVT